MVTFELSTLEIFVFGAISTAVVTYVIEQVLTWRDSNIIAIQKRSDEFIEYSKKYYMPLTWLVAGIETETDPIYPLRPIGLFFQLAKYLNFCERCMEEGILFIFPKHTQECKVVKYEETLHEAINLLIFNDNREAVKNVIKYYKTNPDFLSFQENIDALPEYNTFKSICKNKKIIEKLHDYSNALCNSILEGITDEYRAWYRFEILKLLTERNINKNAERDKKTIRELYSDVYKKKLGD